MKKVIFILLAVIALAVTASAIDITTVDAVDPTDEMFMDMATTAAKKSIAGKGPASGAVIILNGAWRSTGIPSATETAEEAAFNKSRLGSLRQANVYTVNEPTTETINFLNSLDVNAIYFVNGRDAVVAAGIYPASAYNDSQLNTTGHQGKIVRIAFPEAEQLLK